MKITEDRDEMIKLGRQVMIDNPKLYSQQTIDDLWEITCRFYDNKKAFVDDFYQCLYCCEVYGTIIEEFALYGFKNKSHEEKCKYLTTYNSVKYLKFLNDEHDTHLLENKYKTYQILKPFYKRDVMLLSNEDDYETFIEFVNKHKSIFVKPINFSRAEGVHRLKIDENVDIHQMFYSLLKEANNLCTTMPGRHVIKKLILEEEIIPSSEITKFSSNEMSILRVTTVLVDGKVHFLYPIFRMMCESGKSHGEDYSLEALIDEQTGVVITDGLHSFMKREFHPITGNKIKGFTMPEWDQLKKMLITAANVFPTVRYIGWDIAHSNKGWCIIEGNPKGEFFSQMCVGHGIRDEFCKLIKYPEK